MISFGCIFCHAEIVSDFAEDINARYESHLSEWHNISDEGERMLAMSRTMQRLVENNNVSEPEDGWSSSKNKKLSSKIKEALNVGSSGKSQFTFENEEFVVSASFLGDFSDDEVSSNPDATTVKRGELDFENLHDVHLLDESIGENIGAAQVGNEFTESTSHVAEEGFMTPLQIGVNSNPSNDAAQLALENYAIVRNVGKDVTDDTSVHHVNVNKESSPVEEEGFPTPLHNEEYITPRNNEATISEIEKSEKIVEKNFTKEEAEIVDKSINREIVENTCINASNELVVDEEIEAGGAQNIDIYADAHDTEVADSHDEVVEGMNIIAAEVEYREYAEDIREVNEISNKDLHKDVLENPFYNDSTSSNESEVASDDDEDNAELLSGNDVSNNGVKETGEKESSGVDLNNASLLVEANVLRSCSVKMSKLSENVATRNSEEDNIKVPWFEAGYHRCVVCDCAVFLGSVDRHLQLHHTTKEEYMVEHMVGHTALAIPSYECLVCGASVSHTNKNVSAHLKLHSIDMSSYYFQYVVGDGVFVKPEVGFNNNIENDETPEPGASSENENTTPNVINECNISKHDHRRTNSEFQTPKSKRTKLSSPNSNDPDTLPWYEGSWHRCMECGEVTTMGRFFTSHVKVGHKMTKMEYMDKYPEDAVDTYEDWKCEICGKRVAWCVRSIAAHLSKAHSMSKEDYASKYIELVGNNAGKENGENSMEPEEQEEGTMTERPEENGVESPQDLQVVYDKYL